MSSSRIQRKVGELLRFHFGGYTIRECCRPDWLSTSKGRLELDFMIEEIKTAIEVQGDQHYKFVPFFHGSEEGYQLRRERDEIKRIACERQGIRLIEIYTDSDADELIKLLLSEIRPKKVIPVKTGELVNIAKQIDLIDKHIRHFYKMLKNENESSNPRPLRIAKLKRKVLEWINRKEQFVVMCSVSEPIQNGKTKSIELGGRA